jgi:hypothetical protein
MKQPGERPNRPAKSCVHHWMCGDQRATIVHAVCKKCGAEADFEQHWYSPGMIKRNPVKVDPRPPTPVVAPS